MQQNLTVPCNVEAEIALLGCVLIDENLMVELSDLLLPDDFYDVKNRLIYRTMLNLSKEGKKYRYYNLSFYLRSKSSIRSNWRN